MPEFWVYENWQRRRMRIHRSDCSYCNNGTGWKPSKSGENGRWHGPYSSDHAASALTKEWIVSHGVV
jgi:hypothetical protein